MVTQFARGHVNTWATSPMVPADGQQVIGRLSDGSVDVRIGDGVQTWPSLPRVGALESAITDRLDRSGIDAVSEGVVADGVTDCTAALQGLLDAHDTVILTPGTYAISSSLRLKSGQTLIGTDRDKVIIRALLSMANNLNLIQSANTRTDGVEHTNYAEKITIANLTVDGRGNERPATLPAGTHGCNIKFSTVRDSRIVSVRSMNGFLHNIDVCASQYQPSPPPGSVGTPETANKIMPGPSERVLISDCISHDSVRDDPITCHDSVDIIIQRCHAYRTRPLTSGDIHGIEVDEGNRRVAVIDCLVEDHNVGFQVKSHTPTTPARDVHLARCRAVRCRTSFHIYSANPSTLEGGAVSWAKNVSLIDCESIDVERKAIVPDELITYALYVAGYRNVQVRNFIIRGGTGSYANNITADFGADNLLIDGLYVNGACAAAGDTGTGRGLITTASAYGQGSSQVTIRSVMVESPLKIPVFRATNTATTVDIDAITATGTTGPMIYLGAVSQQDSARRLVQTGYASLIQVGGGTFAGMINTALLPGTGVQAWTAALSSAYTTTATVADTGLIKTVPVRGPSDVFLVEVSLDVNALSTASSPFVGRLNVDGTDQSSQINMQSPAVNGFRTVIAKTYAISGLAAGDREFKVRASASTAGNYRVNNPHSTLTIWRLGPGGLGAIG